MCGLTKNMTAQYSHRNQSVFTREEKVMRKHLDEGLIDYLFNAAVVFIYTAAIAALFGATAFAYKYHIKNLPEPVEPMRIITLSNLSKNDGVTLISDGGLCALAPKNTYAAFARAKQSGYGYILLFIRESLDGELIVTDEQTADRLTDAKGKISSLTLEELENAEIDNGANIEEYRGLHWLSLEPALIFCAENKMAPVIEFETLKDSSITKMFALLSECGIKKNECLIASGDGVQLKNLKKSRPEYKYCYSVKTLSEDFSGYLKNNGIDTVMFLNPDETAETARSYASEGIRLICRNADSVSGFYDMYNCGVRIFVTKCIVDKG